MRHVLPLILAIACGGSAAAAVAAVVPLDALTTTDGKPPVMTGIRPDGLGQEDEERSGSSTIDAETGKSRKNPPRPYAVLEGDGEAVLAAEPRDGATTWALAIHCRQDGPVQGRLFLPAADGAALAAVPFTIPAAVLTQHADAARCAAMRAAHYRRLLDRGVSGAAWFRHQLLELGQAVAADGARPARRNREDAETLMGLFSGSRAMSENLQLDRGLALDSALPVDGPGAGDPRQAQPGERQVVVQPKDTLSGIARDNGTTVEWVVRRNRLTPGPLKPGDRLVVPAGSHPPAPVPGNPVAVEPTPSPRVDLATITGITVRAFDWAPLLTDVKPPGDVLASRIPADQHALFFPSFATLTAVLDQADAIGTPALHMAEPLAQDARTRERCQQQLCLEMSDLARQFGPQVVASVAITGSDASLRNGTDVAVLFAARQPALLRTFLAAKLTTAIAAGATAATGTIAGVSWSGATTVDRSVCAYLAALDADTLVMTNSLAQLKRLVAVAAGTEPALAKEPEYAFFRNRYALADGAALLVLSDATIRRWCSPRWRIGDSRRTRAAAILAELNARQATAIATGATASLAAQELPGMGTIAWTPEGARSSLYGSLGRMTPVIELALDQVAKAEAEAYARWRDGYQRYWSAYFDPIALELRPAGGTLTADLTVMPLIAGSDYRELVRLTQDAKIEAGSGDPHGALLHLAVAMNLHSAFGRQAGGFLSGMNQQFGTNPLGWVGSSLHLYAEKGAFWDEMLTAGRQVETFAQKNLGRLPLALHVEVADGLQLTAFLTALHAYADSSAPGMTAWETRKHLDQPYVRIGMGEEGRGPLGDAALCYAATPSALVVSFNEDLIKRFLERRVARRKAKADGTAIAAEPWPGDSVALRLGSRPLEVLTWLERMEAINGRGPDRMPSQTRLSWANLPILNEWHRLFPGHDPVAVHERLFGVRLVCPGGGTYAWDERMGSMASTVYGCPAAPLQGPAWPRAISDLIGADCGLTFEHDGIRARVVLTQAKP